MSLLQRLARRAVLIAVVAAVRPVVRFGLGRVGVRRISGVRVADLGSRVAEESRAVGSRAVERVAEALALLEQASSRTLRRIKRHANFVALQDHAVAGVGFDPVTRGISLSRVEAGQTPPERLAIVLAVGAVLAAYGWANYRLTGDVRARMHRRIAREAEALMDELKAAYPTLEWFRGWHGGRLPVSEVQREEAVQAVLAAVEAPRWLVRLRNYLWQ